MNRIKGIALGLGATTLIVVGLACGAGEKQVPAETEPVSNAQQAQGQPGPSSSSVIPMGTPRVSLTYEGVVYYQNALSTDDLANLKEADLEIVGVTTESNLLAPGSGKSLDIYNLKDSESNHVYTLAPGQSFQNEDGTMITWETAWVRWAAAAGDHASPGSAKSPTNGLCLPPVPLAVSVGDTWTISGPVQLTDGFPTELPAGAAAVSRTFTVDGVATTTYAGGQGNASINHPTIQLKVANVTRDSDGHVLSTEDDPRAARGGWTPASVVNLSPVLTPDWECHKEAWLNAWPLPAQPSIGERVLSSGVTAVVFTVRQPLLLPDLGIEVTTEAHHGYDKLTGRVVLQQAHHTGTRNGAPFNLEMLMELAPVE